MFNGNSRNSIDDRLNSWWGSVSYKTKLVVGTTLLAASLTGSVYQFQKNSLPDIFIDKEPSYEFYMETVDTPVIKPYTQQQKEGLCALIWFSLFSSGTYILSSGLINRPKKRVKRRSLHQ